MSARSVQSLQQFVEELALLYEGEGIPRMAGRILGWLLVCEPPEQTLDDLARALRGSKGSMSTMTRLLENAGLIERYRPAGHRRDHFRITPGMWMGNMRKQMQAITRAREIFDRGLALMSKRPAEVRARLQTGHDLYCFFEKEAPRLLERWEREAGQQPQAPERPRKNV